MSVYGYRYGRVPEGLLYSEASDRACRLHAVLTRWSDTRSGEHPTREDLAGLLHCSVDSVDRAVKELEARLFLEVRPQYAEDGRSRIANDYVLLEGRTGAAGGGRNDAATLTSANEKPAGEGGRSPAARGSRTGAAAIEVRDRTQIEAKKEKNLQRQAAIEQVYEAWKASAGRNGGTKLTDQRRSKINARLEEGYTLEELVTAVTIGWQADPWADRPRHNDLTVLLRDGSQVEKFVMLAAAPPAPVSPVRYSLNGDHVTPPAELKAWAERRRAQREQVVPELEARP